MYISDLIVKFCCDITRAQFQPGAKAHPLTCLLELDTMWITETLLSSWMLPWGKCKSHSWLRNCLSEKHHYWLLAGVRTLLFVLLLKHLDFFTFCAIERRRFWQIEAVWDLELSAHTDYAHTHKRKQFFQNWRLSLVVWAAAATSNTASKLMEKLSPPSTQS